ncbi:hypothetical protein BD626DRAFT_540752 [Schizophyllum amplum]|uniref:Uncharacterized protein n=1 Tax=Schizophyllum amplum TaxID=97359 RepID=A0A550BX68_9AGAR|nr:hypothetical protein BD626DRAFT_540752 [Auriculariopsis ampla]
MVALWALIRRDHALGGPVDASAQGQLGCFVTKFAYRDPSSPNAIVTLYTRIGRVYMHLVDACSASSAGVSWTNGRGHQSSVVEIAMAGRPGSTRRVHERRDRCAVTAEGGGAVMQSAYAASTVTLTESGGVRVPDGALDAASVGTGVYETRAPPAQPAHDYRKVPPDITRETNECEAALDMEAAAALRSSLRAYVEESRRQCARFSICVRLSVYALLMPAASCPSTRAHAEYARRKRADSA